MILVLWINYLKGLDMLQSYEKSEKIKEFALDFQLVSFLLHNLLFPQLP